MSSALRLSVGVNIALAAVVAIGLWRDGTWIKRPAVSAEIAVAPQRESPRASTAARLQPTNPSGTRVTPAAIAQLEQLGLARDIIVEALLADVNRRTTGRLVALQKQYAPRLVPKREMLELSRRCDAEQVSELMAALGEDGYRAWDKEQTLRALNRARVPGDELPMTADEAEQAYRLQKEFDQKAKELQMAMEDGVADPADVGTLQAQAQQALDRNLEQLLGKQRFSELRGNTDPATEVYRTYGDLNPTPDQAKAVLQAEESYRTREAALAQQLAASPDGATNVAAALQALQEAQETELRKALGADAYENSKREHDATYQTIKQYAGAWDLKDEEIQPVYESIRDFNAQTALTRSAAEMSQTAGQKVNWREINAAIEQARQQTEAGLQNLIGSERLRRIEQNGVLAPR